MRSIAATSSKTVFRICTDLKIAVRERSVLGILHKDAVALFNVCSDLRRVCWTLWDDKYALPREDHEVKVFMSFRPMLCKRNEKSLEHIVKQMMKDNAVRSLTRRCRSAPSLNAVHSERPFTSRRSWMASEYSFTCAMATTATTVGELSCSCVRLLGIHASSQ